MNENEDDQESTECCGNGCNNCVLDVRTKKQHNIDNGNTTRFLNIISSIYCLFKLSSIEKCTENTFKYDFIYHNVNESIDLNECCLDIPAGSHVFLRAPKFDMITEFKFNPIFDTFLKSISFETDEPLFLKEKYDKNTEGEFICRPYTPIFVSRDGLNFSILVKIINGPMSKYLMTLNVDDVVEVKGTYGDFVWTENSMKKICCFTQGVGLSPIYHIISSILANENDETIVYLNACFKNLENILLRKEIYDFRQFWNFYPKIFLSRENVNDPVEFKRKLKYNEEIFPHRLTADDIASMVTDLDKNNDIYYLICGDLNFKKFIVQNLEKFNRNNFYLF